MIEPIDDSFSIVASSPESLRQQRLTSTQFEAHGLKRNYEIKDYPDYYDQVAEHDFATNQATIKQPRSTRSSISSFPASVIHNNSFEDYEDEPRTPSRSSSRRAVQEECRTTNPALVKHSPARGYQNGFRNPSSVRALQMCESEYDDSDGIIPYHRRKDSRVSHFSHRSSNSLSSSPTKRSSRSNTPRRQLTGSTNSMTNMKKEFPLVLLHCTLLPPTVATRGALVTDEILEAILPEQYRKRWKTLQDKTIKNIEVKQRGVLIPHPRDDYDLLEECLLEALELQRPRIRQSHYLGSTGDTDSGFESGASQTDDSCSDDGEAGKNTLGEKCPDCGTHVTFQNTETERKWEVKVYAANGLMRGGAWAAAWSEMEKVDVEVGVWMPEEIRRDVDAKLEIFLAKQDADAEEERLAQEDREFAEQEDQRKRQSDTGMQSKTQEEIDGLDDMSNSQNVPQQTQKMHHPPVSLSNQQPTIQELVQHRVKNIFQDQRNFAILLLSLLVLFFAITSASKEGAAAATVAAEVAKSSVNISVSSVLSDIESIVAEVTQGAMTETEQPIHSVTTTTTTEFVNESTYIPSAVIQEDNRVEESNIEFQSEAEYTSSITDDEVPSQARPHKPTDPILVEALHERIHQDDFQEVESNLATEVNSKSNDILNELPIDFSRTDILGSLEDLDEIDEQ